MKLESADFFSMGLETETTIWVVGGVLCGGRRRGGRGRVRITWLGVIMIVIL